MSDDIVTLLKNDHQAAKAILQRFDELAPSGRQDYFCEVLQTLVGHEVAEELVVYPLIRKNGPQGDRVADDRLAEQADTEQLLADMESQDTGSGAFTAQFKKLRDSVIAHAQAEESTAFPLLESMTTTEERRDLGARYEKAKDRAPTHAHPHTPDTPPGNKVLGPVAAVFDRARDAVQRA
jgi:hemerythrin superfamily protein